MAFSLVQVSGKSENHRDHPKALEILQQGTWRESWATLHHHDHERRDHEGLRAKLINANVG